MTPEQKGSLPLQVEKLFYDLQDRIFSDVVRRIKKTGEITSTADYQINKLLILGNSTEFIEQEIQRLTGKTDPEMWELYDKVSNWEYVRYEAAYQQINSHFIPLEDNEQVQRWSQAIIFQTNAEIRNITQSLGMTVDIGGGRKAFTPLSQYYQKYLDRACMDIVTGAFDYNTVLRRVVNELSASGLRTIDYASGYSSRVPVAARRAIMTGVSQLSAKINEMVAKDLGTDTFEVTWHAGHRPTHWWGGNVYTREELIAICGLGDVGGLCGANCRHSYYAFIPGVSVRTYTPEQLRELEAKERETQTWNGKEYTPYEVSQMQRQMETKMRSQRVYVKGLQQGGADQEDIIAAKARYLNTLHQYQAFSKRMGISEQMERVYMDGLGRVALPANKQKRIEKTLQRMYNKNNTEKNIKAYEADLRGLKKYREKFPDAELFHYRLNKALMEKGLIRGYVVPAKKQHAYILDDLRSKRGASHIMKRMLERNITDDQVQEYIDTALFAVLHYQDTRLAYYSPTGVAVLTKTTDYKDIDWIVKTVWSKVDFDERIDEILKEAKKYG